MPPLWDIPPGHCHGTGGRFRSGLFLPAGLTPISDTYGWRYGLFAAILHYYMVTTVPNLHGGFCLYNGGFTANLVCILLLPILEHHFKTKQQRLEMRNSDALLFE